MLSEKVCIVVGGAHGIGKATAIGLADLGASVVVSDLGTSVQGEGENKEPVTDVVEEIRDDGGKAIPHFGDVSSLDDTSDLVETTFEEFGRIDGAVNFAGVLNDSVLVKMSGDEWDQVIQVHLRGHFSLFRSLGEHWRERSKADEIDSQRSLLAVSSLAATGNPGQANYSAAKAGILGLTRTAARELPRYSVRVNALLPSAFTRMTEEIPEEKRPYTREERPPEKVVPIIAYLMSDAAEDVNGCTFHAGGEMMRYMSDPQPKQTAYREGGWTADSVRDRFRDLFGDEELNKREGVL